MKQLISILSLLVLFSCSKENITPNLPADDKIYFYGSVLGEKIEEEVETNDWKPLQYFVNPIKYDITTVPIKRISTGATYEIGLSQFLENAQRDIFIRLPWINIPDEIYNNYYSFEKIVMLLEPGQKTFQKNETSASGFAIRNNFFRKDNLLQSNSYGDQTGSTFEILSRVVNETERIIYAKCKMDCKLYSSKSGEEGKYLGDFKGIFNVRLEYMELFK